jgi:hypothetical protein
MRKGGFLPWPIQMTETTTETIDKIETTVPVGARLAKRFAAFVLIELT